MKTDVILVSGEGRALESALDLTAAVAAEDGLSHKGCLHLRLLAEEMMGMMRSITGKPQAEFWIEREAGGYQLHLRVSARMNSEKRDRLVAASTSGKNEAARGLMGRLRSFFEFGYEDEVPSFPSSMLPGNIASIDGTTSWSMLEYREALRASRADHREGAEEAWDELEKSVVSHVADEVKVSVRGHEAEMIIFKKLA